MKLNKTTEEYIKGVVKKYHQDDFFKDEYYDVKFNYKNDDVLLTINFICNYRKYFRYKLLYKDESLYIAKLNKNNIFNFTILQELLQIVESNLKDKSNWK